VAVTYRVLPSMAKSEKKICDIINGFWGIFICSVIALLATFVVVKLVLAVLMWWYVG
jgi:hypothetical protein